MRVYAQVEKPIKKKRALCSVWEKKKRGFFSESDPNSATSPQRRNEREREQGWESRERLSSHTPVFSLLFDKERAVLQSFSYLLKRPKTKELHARHIRKNKSNYDRCNLRKKYFCFSLRVNVKKAFSSYGCTVFCVFGLSSLLLIRRWLLRYKKKKTSTIHVSGYLISAFCFSAIKLRDKKGLTATTHLHNTTAFIRVNESLV